MIGRGLTPSPVLFISIWFALLLCKLYYFTFSSAILIVLNDNLDPIALCRIWHFFKYQIDMCSYSLLLVNFIFCCELCFFSFFTCMPDMCSWGTNYTFWRYCHLRFYHHMSTKVRSILVWSTPSLDPYLSCTFWGSIASLAEVPYMSHLKWWNGVNFISSSVYLNIICSTFT